MEFRTLDGMIGYADGYNLCFKQFCEYLIKHDKDEAIRKMKLLVTAVNSVVSDEPQTEIPEYAEWKEPFEKMTDCPWK